MIPCDDDSCSRKRDLINLLQKRIRIGSIVTVTGTATTKIGIPVADDIMMMMMMIAILAGADTVTTQIDIATAETATETEVANVAHTVALEVRLRLENAGRVGRRRWIDAGLIAPHHPPDVGHRRWMAGAGPTAHLRHLDIGRGRRTVTPVATARTLPVGILVNGRLGGTEVTDLTITVNDPLLLLRCRTILAGRASWTRTERRGWPRCSKMQWSWSACVRSGWRRPMRRRRRSARPRKRRAPPAASSADEEPS